MQLIHGDCLIEMDKLIAQGVKVDAVICDPPYGTTSLHWDSVIPFDAMWLRLNQLIKPNGAICLFGLNPFSSLLIASNIKNYKYDWIWEKAVGGNFANVKYMPRKDHEIISVFGNGRLNYYPIMQMRKNGRIEKSIPRKNTYKEVEMYSGIKEVGVHKNYNETHCNPSSVQYFNNRIPKDRGLHPTQKPVALLEYLIKTYTQENELVLDFTAGSFSTAIACMNTNRNFIGIELDEKYYNIGVDRINKHKGLL